VASLLIHALTNLVLIQAPSASVQGTVRDAESGAPLPGAIVALPDLRRTATVDPDGRYRFADVPPGPQHITVRFLGFEPRMLHALVPPQGALEINLSMRAVALHLRPIEVRPPTAFHRAEDDSAGFPDRSVSIAAVRNHPLLAEPDGLMALGGGEVVLQPESPSGVHVRGGGSDQTGYLLDGIPVLSPYHTGGLFSAWNPDALAGLRLSASGPSSGYADALSGTIAAVTRTPGSRLQMQASLGTSQARLTVDGPIGATGAALLLSVRSGFAGSFAPAGEASYLHGRSGDRLITLETPAVGGGLRLLAYDNDNLIGAAATVLVDTASLAPARNRLAWHSRSLGTEWRREWREATVRVQGWSAAVTSGAAWSAEAGHLAMASRRADLGALAALERRSGRSRTEVGIRIERSRTTYDVRPDTTGAAWSLHGTTPVAGVFVRHARALGPRLDLELGTTASLAAGTAYADPGVRLRWRLAGRLAVSGSYGRRHQFAQSLRNPESVVGNIFPADLYAGVGAAGVPAARSDQAVLAAEYRPSPGIRIGAQGWLRAFGGLLLVAPRAAEPFTTDGFTVGSGRARGVALDGSVATARYAVVASYGFQRVRLGNAALGYTPGFATAHLLDAGVIVSPTARTSVRLGMSGAAGRRATAASGTFEWEACNLRDNGCELAGSPHYRGAPLGALRLPSYVRLDLGVRQRWRIQVAGRDAELAAFCTMTNLLGRTNVLTYADDPITGGPSAVEMRPFAPLVLGLDWQF
jgi:hypothetical protein